MELFYIYLWLKLNLFLGILSAFTTILFIILLVAFFWVFTETYYYHQDGPQEAWDIKKAKQRKKFWRFLWIPPLVLLLTIAIPTQKDTAILVGSSYALDMAKSPEGQKVQSLLRKKVNEYLDEQLKEVKK